MPDESALPAVLRQKLPPNLEKIKYGHYEPTDYDYPIYLYLKENDIGVKEEGSDIIQFLRGKNILVTGATGFLGKLLVEKLLRCCKGIGTIYVIIRTKRGKDSKARLTEYLDDWVFYKLSEINPHYREKVVGISGDFELDGLSLSESSIKTINEQVNLIYHVAATIRFDEKLKKAVKINIRGTQEIIQLAKGCKKLNAFVHLSTAFSNCHEKVVKEEFYPPHFDPYKLMKATEALSDDIIAKTTPEFLGSVPNTYAFTKQIAEDLVRQEAVGIPACIHRPSIVVASVKEPVRSWVDNIFGPVGLIVGASLGILHVIWGSTKTKCSLVPADYVINSCIASSYKTSKDRQLDKVQIFNYTSDSDNPLCWNDLLHLAEHQGSKVGTSRMLYKYFYRFTRNYYWFYFLNFLLHIIPAYIVDFVAVKLGKKPQLAAAYEKINKFNLVLAYFTLNEWVFENNNTRNLWDSLSATDKKNFSFDMSTLDWPNYCATYLVALRELLVLDFLDTLEEGRQHVTKLTIIHYVVLTTITGLSVYFLLNTIFCFIPLTIITIIIFYNFPVY